jgi:hypothetical protein
MNRETMIQKDRQRKKKNGGQKQDIINRHGELNRKIGKEKRTDRGAMMQIGRQR